MLGGSPSIDSLSIDADIVGDELRIGIHPIIRVGKYIYFTYKVIRMNHTQTYYISSKENHDMQKNKVLCQEKNNSLMIQFDNLSSLNRANVK